MKYLMYKVTNRLDGKFYVGCHKTKNVNDGYMGSGKYLKNAQNKHGIDNFEKDILAVFDNSEAMFEMESMIVNEDFIKDEATYNIKKGGEGGFDYINENGIHKYDGDPNFGQKHKERMETDVRYRDDYIERLKERHRKGLVKYDTFTGMKHSDEAKKKMSKARKGKYVGQNNPSFGTMWVYSSTEKKNKRIKKEELSAWEAKGWLKGRKMNF